MSASSANVPQTPLERDPSTTSTSDASTSPIRPPRAISTTLTTPDLGKRLSPDSFAALALSLAGCPSSPADCPSSPADCPSSPADGALLERKGRNQRAAAAAAVEEEEEAPLKHPPANDLPASANDLPAPDSRLAAPTIPEGVPLGTSLAAFQASLEAAGGALVERLNQRRAQRKAALQISQRSLPLTQHEKAEKSDEEPTTWACVCCQTLNDLSLDYCENCARWKDARSSLTARTPTPPSRARSSPSSLRTPPPRSSMWTPTKTGSRKQIKNIRSTSSGIRGIVRNMLRTPVKPPPTAREWLPPYDDAPALYEGTQYFHKWCRGNRAIFKELCKTTSCFR